MANALPPCDPETILVPMGRWAVQVAPTRVRCLLGSCVAVTLHNRISRIGGLAHIVLPDSGGKTEEPGRYVNTAVPAMLRDLQIRCGLSTPWRFVAKLVGGSNMFPTPRTQTIGDQNQKSAERILRALGIPIVACDVGGESGRKVTLDTSTGKLAVKPPGGETYWI